MLVVPTTYWPLTETEVLRHFEAINEAIDIPLGLYINPWTTGVDILPSSIARIAELDNFSFVKESSSDMARIPGIKRLTGERITILNGWDSSMPAAMGFGVDGWFAGSCSIMPKHCVELYRLGQQGGDLIAANALFQRMFPVCDFMTTHGYIRVAHAACQILGRDMGEPRRPILGLQKDERETLSKLLEELGPPTAD